MRSKKKSDLFEEIAKFQRNLIKNKPSIKNMYDEVRMMKYKIRPLQGDISYLNLKNKKFIEILWNLGKLDDFFNKNKKELNKREEEIFKSFFENLYSKLQSQLNKLDLKIKEKLNAPLIIEMEITREIKKNKLN
jgi:hypothetical protein